MTPELATARPCCCPTQCLPPSSREPRRCPRRSCSFVRIAAGGGGARGGAGATRRKKRLQLIILLVVVGAAGVSGFALSQWLTTGERAAQGVMQRELQARVAEIGRTASQLELTRGSERAEIENGVLRRIGATAS